MADRGPDDCPEGVHTCCLQSVTKSSSKRTGGKHKFPVEPTSSQRVWCIMCLPCLALLSCCNAVGGAFANPSFEQSCCGTGRGGDPDTCVKCTLSKMETQQYWAAGMDKREQKELRKSYANFEAQDNQLTQQPGARKSMEVPRSPIPPSS